MKQQNILSNLFKLAVGLAIGVTLILTGCGGGGGGGSSQPPAPSVVTLTNIVITPSVVSIIKGSTATLAARGTYSDGTTADITSTVKWVTNDYAVVSVDPGGVVAGAGAGSNSITATLDGVTSNVATFDVTSPVNGVLSGLAAGNSITLGNGLETLTLTANGSFSFATQRMAGSAYSMTITTPPANQSCTMTYGSSTMTAVSSLRVLCGLKPRGGFILAAKPTILRSRSSATLLPSGKVLIAGGFNAAVVPVVPLSSAELYDPVSQTWLPAGNLTSTRENGKAVLLPNGKVLIVGGGALVPLSPTGYSTSAELYDPSTNAWTTAGNFYTARGIVYSVTVLPSGKVFVEDGVIQAIYDPTTNSWEGVAAFGLNNSQGHTITLLSNGKLLVVGGSGTGGPRNSSLLYDPAANIWTAAANMGSGNHRSGHTATLLPSGKVLVAGGYFGGSITQNSAQLYDPVTDTWASAGTMSSRREYATATLLTNGQVLIAGGQVSGASAEIYDPATNTWTFVDNLIEGLVGRRYHNAMLLQDGKVLLDAGFISPGFITPNFELFSLDAGHWSPSSSASMPDTKYYPTATLLTNGLLFIAGNSSSGSSYFLYDSALDLWSRDGYSLRHYHTATLLADGKVLLAGGSNNSVALATAELFDSKATTSQARRIAASSLATARQSHSATLLPNGKVLVAGGSDSTGTSLASAEIYNPTTDTWSAAGTLASARQLHTAMLLFNGKVLVAGGSNGSSALVSAELYDPTTNTWSSVGNLATARKESAATLLSNGKVLVSGGVNGMGMVSSAELYDPIANAWSSAGGLSTPRHLHTSTLLSNGKVMAAGGENGLLVISSVEIYDPTANTWTVAGNLNIKRREHTVTLLPNGKLMAAGGFDAETDEFYW